MTGREGSKLRAGQKSPGETLKLIEKSMKLIEYLVYLNVLISYLDNWGIIRN